MSDVSCRVFPFFEVAAEQARFPIEELTAGLPISLDELRDPSRHCSWEVWAELCDRLEARVDRATFLELGANMQRLPFSEGFLDLASSWIETPQLYRAITDWLAPVLFRNARFATIVHSSNRVTVTIDLPTDRRSGAAWMRLAASSLRRLPEIVGSPAAHEQGTITSHHARLEYTFEPRKRQHFVARLLDRLRFATSPRRLLDDLTRMQQDLSRSFERLSQRERELRILLERIPLPLVVSAEGRVLFVNDAFSSRVRANPPSLVDELFEPAADSGSDVDVVTDHGVRCFEVSSPVALDYDGQSALLLVLRDVTEERREARQLAVTNRLAALGTLAAFVGHELNNPLAYVVSSLEVLRRELDHPRTDERDAELRDMVETALRGLDRAAVIGRDLHTFARPATREHQPVDLHESLELALRMANADLRHVAEVRRDYDRELPPVRADEAGLGQVFLNILLNASQAVRESPDPDKWVAVRTRRAGEWVVTEIEDNGIGIAEDLRARIFEPFFTTKGTKGTGLGLAVCRRIVDDHSGALTVRSEVGVGTTFRIELPVTTVTPEIEMSKSESEVRLDSVRVLVVDDEPILGRLIERMLAPRQVSSEVDPESALERLMAEPFDVVLCDLTMPGLSGPELHQRVAEQRPEVASRFVFMTGGAFTEESGGFLASVPNPQLLKPFRREQLEAVVDLVLREVP